MTKKIPWISQRNHFFLQIKVKQKTSQLLYGIYKQQLVESVFQNFNLSAIELEKWFIHLLNWKHFQLFIYN